jgi:AcrR family transcriptional regulator
MSTGAASGAESTRTRIQHVALELFTEQGYEKTSLREIAERLGVTKAALYYHFKTKDEIVASFAEDRLAAVEELADWLKTQPRTRETRRELIRRYARSLEEGRHHEVMRFFERNQTSLTQLPTVERMRQRMLDLVDALAEPDAPLPRRIKASMSLFALHATWILVRDPRVTDEQRRVAALEVALDLLDDAAPGAPTGPPG